MSLDEAPSRLLLANLDAEAELSGQTLTRSARRNSAAFGTLLRVLAQPGDHLHLTAPVDASRLGEVPGLTHPVLHNSEEDGKSGNACGPLLAWCETPRIASLRRHRPTPPPCNSALPIHQMLWQLQPPTPEVVAKVHHRAFHLQMTRRLGCALPGARLLHSAQTLEEHLKQGGAQASKEGAWVLKAPLSTAGRGRLLSSGSELAPTTRRRVDRLFARCGELLFEPWMQRTLDFGLAGVITPQGPLFLGQHRQLVDRRGVFRGVEFSLDRKRLQHLDPVAQKHLDRTFDEVAQALLALDFRGPFGIDGWCYPNAQGVSVLHPLGEINARLTFGIVARLLGERLRLPLRLAPGQALRLCLGPAERSHAISQGTMIWPLLKPDLEGNGAITLEIGPKPA